MMWDKLSNDEKFQRRNTQMLYEQDMLEYGRLKYWNDYNRAPDEGIPEQTLIDTSIKDLRDSYQEWIDKVCSSRKSPHWIYPLLELGPEKMADIAIRAIIRCWFSSSFWGYQWNEDQHTPPLAQKVATQIAQDACDIIGFQRARDEFREDWKKQSKFVKNWTTKRCKAFTLKMEKNVKLSVKQKHDFGHHMLRIAAASNVVLLTAAHIKKNRKLRKYLFVEFHPEILKELHERHDLLQNSALVYRPMVAPPEDHTLIESGGYIHTALRKPVVQRYKSNFFGEYKKKQKFSEPSKLVMDGLNSMMKSEWAINTKVLEVMENLFENNTGLANLPYYSFTHFMFNEEFPIDGSTESKAIWCQQREEAWGEWYKQEQSRGRMLVRLKLANDMKKWSFFYHVYTLDFRGRAYTICELLSPQSSDIDRGLIMLANPEKLSDRGRYWQKLNLANLFDQDKIPFDDRVKWTDDNWDMIQRIADDPYDNKEWIDDAKKKNKSFQRLAAIFDITRKDGYSQVATQLDGKCNGNQHWSAIMRDASVAHLTGVSPSESPQDLYQHVADVTTAHCKKHIDSNLWFNEFIAHWDTIDRKVTKRSTMCEPYGLTFYGIQRYLRTEGHLDWVGRDVRGGAIVELAKAIKHGLDRALVEPNKGKNYLKKVIAKANELNKHIIWTTPSGFKVVHYYNRVNTRRSLAKLFNNKEITFFVNTSDVNTQDALLAIAPNFIHSIDAAHMFLCIDLMTKCGIMDLCMIHDSFGCHPNHVDEMIDIIREVFYEIHKENLLDTFKHEVEKQLGIILPDPPKRGDFDLSCVLGSKYFFS